MKPQKFKHISRAIDKDGVHHLDALDDYGRHWYATMEQKMEFPDNRQLDIMWSVSTSSAIETREKPHRIFAKLLYNHFTNEDIGVKLKDTSQTVTGAL
jgi:hypothetical protein